MEKNGNQKPSVEVSINENWCKKCGICVAFCSKGVFVCDEFGLPSVKYPERCIKCMLCVVRCPDFAVDVKIIEKSQAKK